MPIINSRCPAETRSFREDPPEYELPSGGVSNTAGGEGKINLSEFDAPVHCLLHDNGSLLVAGARGDNESGVVIEEAHERFPVTRPTGEFEASIHTVHRTHPRTKISNPTWPGSERTGLGEGTSLGDTRGDFALDDGPALILVGDPHNPSEALRSNITRLLLSMTVNELIPSRA